MLLSRKTRRYFWLPHRMRLVRLSCLSQHPRAFTLTYSLEDPPREVQAGRVSRGE
jgi:hypothetical protein